MIRTFEFSGGVAPDLTMVFPTGTFEPELMMAIAKRNGLTHMLPFQNVEEARAAYRCFK
jgi:hypothetical protein